VAPTVLEPAVGWGSLLEPAFTSNITSNITLQKAAKSCKKIKACQGKKWQAFFMFHIF
jgi:hypothetical protein